MMRYFSSTECCSPSSHCGQTKSEHFTPGQVFYPLKLVYMTGCVFQVRPEAAGFRRSVQAYPEEESEDHQEAGAEDRVLRLQVEAPGRG